MHLAYFKALTRVTVWTLALLGAGLAGARSLEVQVLDRDGKPMPDAVVGVFPSAKGTPRHAPPMTAVVNQEKQQFTPAVTVVGAGAKVRFTNNDPWNHHVRLGVPGAPVGAVDGQSVILEGKQEGKAMNSAVFAMDKPGVYGAALLGCFIHSRMSGTVYVAESPWTVKTNAQGVALLEDLPEGAASVKVWHQAQLVEKAPSQVNVQSGRGKATIQLDVSAKRRI
jgi:plastocyanin